MSERAPFIHLQPGEPSGKAPCGCVLDYDEEGSARMVMCPTHEAALEMWALLESVAVGTRDERTAETVLAYLERVAGNKGEKS